MAAIDADGDDLLSFDELWAWWAHSGRGRAPRLPSLSNVAAPDAPPLPMPPPPPMPLPPLPPMPAGPPEKAPATVGAASSAQLMTMAVVVPAGVSEGESFFVRAGSGEYHVTVPAGQVPGATLHIDVPVDVE